MARYQLTAVQGRAVQGKATQGWGNEAVVVVVKVVTDALGLTDSAVTATVLSKAVTDAPGLTDSILKGEAKIKVITETLALTDSVTTVLVYIFINSKEVKGHMSATIREAFPDQPDSTDGRRPIYERLSGTTGARQRVLLDVSRASWTCCAGGSGAGRIEPPAA